MWDYRRQVRTMVNRVIRETPLTLPIDWDSPFWAVLMGIEHERIHLETSSVLIRQHALHYVRPHPDWAPCRDSGRAPDNTLVDIPAGHLRLGRTFDDPYYGWDNEYGRHEADVPAFRAARYLTTNAEFLAFVEAGGYANDDLWDEEGLAWRRYAQAAHPTFWVREGSGWKLRLLAEEVPMPWNWPVETNCHEARAFCRWKARVTGLPVRLPSEDEWHRLYDHAGLTDVPDDAPAAANLHLDHWASSCPVTRFAHGELFDVVGNEARHVSRYAFRRHFFQHTGFRYIVSAAPVAQPGSLYESDALLAQYAEFHYGDAYFGVPNFPQTLAQRAIAAFERHHGGHAGRALDLGCATGRAGFELARHFDTVEGVDFSARFINAGVQLQQHGVLRYTLPDEGELVSYCERRLDTLGLTPYAHKVTFWQGDACNLKPVFSGYDLILAANLIDRLYAPHRFLAQVHERLNPGGLLVIASPYTWLEEHTRREEWLGGFKKDGESWATLDGLKDVLGAHFDLVEGPLDLPFVIRETRRKFQHTVSELTVWRYRQEA